MLQNPIIQTLMLVLGSYTAMTMLKKYGSVGKILTIVAGIFAIVIWMLRYNRSQVAAFYRNPILKPVIDLVCSLTKEPKPDDALASVAAVAPRPPTSAQPAASPTVMRPRPAVSARGAASGTSPSPTAAISGENTHLLIRTDAEYRTLIYRMKEEFAGCDDVIDGTLKQIQNSVRMRERSVSTVNMPPLGMNLYMGKPGLGKKSVAVEISRALYGGDAVAVLDLAERGATLAGIISAARSNPYQSFIIENVAAASQQVQTDLLTIFSGQSLSEVASGALVSFRNCFFFLILHKDAASFPKPVASTAGTGFTVVVNHLAGVADLDQMLALSLHAVYPFRLPEPADQARVIALLMERECNKYGVSLGRVDARIIAREVEEVGRLESFRASPARITRILSNPIGTALARRAPTVNIEAQYEASQ